MTRVDYGGSMGGPVWVTPHVNMTRVDCGGSMGGDSMGYTTCQYDQSRLRGEYGGGQYGLHHMSI